MSVTEEQKNHVRERAGDCCEYCRISQAGHLTRFQIDHIIALKHDGSDEDDNLCLACYRCNIYKGSNVAAADPETGKPSFLFHPRHDIWNAHFKINSDATITGLTPEGRTTIRVLRINDPPRVSQRLGEMTAGDYPCQ